MIPARGWRTVRVCAPAVAVALCLTTALIGCTEPLQTLTCLPTAFDTSAVSGDTTILTSGLRFIDGNAGDGAALDWCHVVAVHYTGFLLDGTKFDSSIDIDRPLQFTPGLGALINGFEQGVIGMRAEGTRRLIIPPILGYGSQEVRDQSGTVIIPANSTLVFDIEVLAVGS